MNTLLLETSRLVIKFLTDSDFPNLLKLRSNVDTMRYIGDDRIHTPDEVERFLKLAMQYQDDYGMGFCAVFEKATQQFVGQAGIFHLGFNTAQDDFEIAYRLLPEFWGKGYATELAKALVDWGFSHLTVKKLVAAAHFENLASKNVLKKTGFMPIGKMRWYNQQDVMGFEIYKSDAIELVPYNPAWPVLARQEISRLREILPQQHIVDLQHVGSTAIPGLLAKPIIDIQIAVDSLAAVKQQAIDQLKMLNYVYWDENPDPTRLFFVKGMPPFGEKREAHVHIVEPQSPHWQDKLLFRDYLLTHPATLHEYAVLKQQLAAQYRYDREQYTESKTSFIKTVLELARRQSIALE